MNYKILLSGVKKSIIFFTLIFLLISQTNIGVVYAQSVAELESQKDASIEVLDKTEIVVDKVIDKLDEKINDEREERLREKEEEIGDYIEEVQEKIQKENSSSDVKALVKEAKKVVVLKVVSGATEYEDVTDNISSEVANTPSEKADAVETIQESLETKSGDYSILIKTKYAKSQLKKLFDKFDTKIKLDLMYSDSGEDYYEVFIDEDSIFRQEMLEDIESGNLPENFFGVEIIFPEVFSITNNPLRPSDTSPSLQGEDIGVTWGIQQYKTYGYLDDIDDSVSVKVGVVDTGIDYNHPDLSENVSGGYDFVNDDSDAMDDQGHGTHVAGTIAANINGKGIIGVNPKADLVPLKICNARGFCPSYAVLRALDYAKSERIDILNMSLGGRGTVADHPICAGISAYTDAGGIVVSASGNSNIDTSRFVPGGCSDAITVAAVDNSGNRAPFSNYGSKVDVAAPGVGVYSTIPGNQYRSLSGTSMATPHIVGLVSLIQSQNSDITTSEIKTLLKKYPSSVSTTSGKSIASAVDIARIMNSFNEDETVEVAKVVEEEKEEEEVVVVEEKSDEQSEKESIEESFSLSDGETEMILESTTDVSISSIPNTNTSDIGPVEDTPIEDDVFISNIQEGILDFGGGDIEINSIQEGDVEIIEEEIIEEIGQEDILENISDVQIFDETGKDISDQVEINSTTDESIDVSAYEVGEDFDFNNLPDFSTGSIDFDSESEEFDFLENNSDSVNEVFIDGAEAGVEINSFSDSEIINIDTYTGSLDLEEQILDEEGNSISFDNLDDIILEEDVLDYTFDEEVFIDGAEAGVEINNVGEEVTPQEIEIDKYFGDQEESFEIIDGEDISGYDSSEEQIIDENTSSESSDIVDVNFIEEFVEEPEYSDQDVFIDGGQPGVEINNIGEEITPEKIEPVIHEENPEIEFENIEGGEIQTPEDFDDQEGEDDIGEDVFIEGELELYESNGQQQEESFGIQNTFSCTIKIGQRCNFRIYKPYRYQFKIDNPGVVSHGWSRRYISLVGRKSGTTVYKMYRYGRHYHTIYVTVEEPPKPKSYDITLVEGGHTNLYLPDNSFYRYSVESQGGSGYLYNYRKYIRVQARNTGTMQFYIRDRYNMVRYIINLKITPQPPKTIDIEIYQGKTTINRMPYSYAHSFSMSEKGIASLRTSGHYLYIKGDNAGATQLYAKRDGIHRYTINIKVKKIPTPKEYNVKVVEGKYSNIYLPDKFSYRYSMQRLNAGYARFYNYGHHGKVMLRGETAGDIKYIIRDNYGLHRYTLNVTVVPKPPKIIELEVFETKTIKQELWRYQTTYRATTSNSSIVAIYPYRRDFYFKGLKAGDVEIYLRDYQGRHVWTLKIKVLPKPEPKVYDIKLKPRNYGKITLPEDIKNYRFVLDGGKIFHSNRGRNELKQIGARTFSYRIYEVGQGKIRLLDSRGFERYVINFDVSPHISNYQINETEQKRFSASRKYKDYDTSIVYISGGYIRAKKAGKTQVRVEDDRRFIGLINITVNPKPDPVIINCTTEINKDCKFKVSNRGYYYRESKRGIARLDVGKTTFRVRGMSAGNIKVYIKARYGNYISHVMDVTVKPEPVRIMKCSTPVGIVCNTNWSGKKYEYTYKVSKGGIIGLKLGYFRSGATRYNRLIVTGKNPGTTDVYVYDKWRHVATFQITVEPPVQKISVSSFDRTIKQGETVKADILTGGGEYRSLKTHSGAIVFFGTSNEDDNTGEIKITGKEAGRTYLSFRDKYNQTYKFGMTVVPTTLKLLPSDIFELKGSEKYQYINISESHGNIQSIELKDKGIVNAYLVQLENGRQVIKVYPKSNGKTLLLATDAGGNKDSVEIVVGKKEEGVAKFESFLLLDDESKEETKNIVAFNVTGEYTEVGIQYKNRSGSVVREKIDYNDDGFYIVQADIDACESCHLAFQPYIKDAKGSVIYPAGIGNYVSLGGDESFQNIAIVDGVGVASSEDDIEISYASTVKYYWNNKEDLGAEYVLRTAALYGNITNLPISSYMLNKFLDGSGGIDYYDNLHWITAELKRTSWYDEKINLAKIEGYNMTNSSSKNIFKCDPGIEISKYITDNYSNNRRRDFSYSFGRVCPYVNLIKNAKGDTYMQVSISDIYDFEPSHLGDVLVDGLNAWGSHYQENNDAVVFKWNLYFTENIN